LKVDIIDIVSLVVIVCVYVGGVPARSLGENVQFEGKRDNEGGTEGTGESVHWLGDANEH